MKGIKKEKEEVLGRKYGKWTILRELEKEEIPENERRRRKRMFECICDCGRKKNIRMDGFLYGRSTSCGICVKREEMIGKKFGNIIVIKEEGRNEKQSWWRCKCSCGREEVFTRQTLNKEFRSACRFCQQRGGIGKYSVMTRMESFLRHIHHQYKEASKAKGRDFELEVEDFKVILDACYYCGEKPSRRYKKTNIFYNGLDRMNNKKGYVKGNVVSCCWRCNKIKLDNDCNYFLDVIKKVYENKKLGEKQNG